MIIDVKEFFSNPVFILTIIICCDLFFGDPIYALHPVRLIGGLIVYIESKLKHIGLNDKIGGMFLVISLLIIVFSVYQIINYLLMSLHWSLVWIWNVFIGWSFIALSDLLFHSKNVAIAIKNKDILESRTRVSMIVGRETVGMDMKACARATVESVSENLNDGVIAPLFYYCFFGISGMIFFKVFNTLDSMVGYKNEKYKRFGWFSAKIDDFFCWIPARLSWFFLSLTACFLPGFSGKDAFLIGLRDYSKLHSPNAGWCEASAAGALRIKLCGPIWREGTLSQEIWLGCLNYREGATYKDIYRMNQLALWTSFIAAMVIGSLLWLNEFLPFFNI